VTLELVTSGTGLGVAPDPTYVPCGALGPGCVERLQHSCQNMVAPAFFGDPAVRIASVVNQASIHQTWSICGDSLDETPSFSLAMQGVGTEMALQAAGGCLPGPLVNPQSPNCSVTIGDSQTSIDHCNTSNVTPCWSIVDDPICPSRTDPNTGFGDTYRLVLSLGGATVDGLVHAQCSTYVESTDMGQ
ncbi:MAG TPA: hypothetical protein VIA18_07545, partial [Polyangia bacterium]|nr:hypothetical protein [Polyangia bacterium]